MGHRFRVSVGLRVPGKNPVSVHVINIAIHNIARNTILPHPAGNIQQLLLAHITVPALLVTKTPHWRQLHSAGEPGIIFELTCNRRRTEEIVIHSTTVGTKKIHSAIGRAAEIEKRSITVIEKDSEYTVGMDAHEIRHRG